MGFLLAPSGLQRRRLGGRRIVVPALLVDVIDDLLPARREGVERLLGPAGDLEARHRSDHRLLEFVAEIHQAARQLIAVVGADQQAAGTEPSHVQAAPRAVRAPGHVGDDAVGVELGIEVAAGQMPEGPCHHALRPAALSLARCRIVHARHEEIPLDHVEGRPDRLVMGPDHPLVAHDEGLERNRLRGRERDVDARAVLVLAVPRPPQTDVGAGNMAGEDGFEGLRFDVTAKGKVAGRRTVPEACPAVFRVVLRIVSVLLEIVHRHGSGRDGGDGGDHDRQCSATRRLTAWSGGLKRRRR